MGIGSKFGITAETGNNIITEGLVFYVDSAYKKSYPRTGTNAFNLASGSLTPTGSLTNDVSWEGINPTSSFAFDGVGDYINVDSLSSVFEGLNTFTINVWANASYANLNPTFIASNGGAASQAFLLYAYDTNTGTKDARVWYNSLSLLSTTNTSLTGWNHFCFIQNGATDSKLYVNAIERASSTTSKTMHTSITDVKIGGTNDFSQYFNGNIANSLVYTRALSAADVLQNFNASKGRFGL